MYVAAICACTGGQSCNVIEFLLEKDAGAIKTKIRNGNMPLHCACSRRCSKEVIEMLQEKYPQALYSFGTSVEETLLHCYAAADPHTSIEVMAILLKYDPREVTDTLIKETILHCACSHKASKKMIELLLAKQPETIQKKDLAGRMPLHYACFFGASTQKVIALY